MIDYLKTWLRTHDSFSHVVEGAIVFFPFWLVMFFIGISNAHWIAAFAVIGGYYGRERRDHELHSGRTLNDISFDIASYMPWNWSMDGKRDFGYPLAAFMLVAAIVEFFVK